MAASERFSDTVCGLLVDVMEKLRSARFPTAAAARELASVCNTMDSLFSDTIWRREGSRCLAELLPRSALEAVSNRKRTDHMMRLFRVGNARGGQPEGAQESSREEDEALFQLLANRGGDDGELARLCRVQRNT